MSVGKIISDFNSEQLLMMAMRSLGGSSEIHASTRLVTHQWENISFSSYSTRLPIDDPALISAADNKLYSRELLCQENIPVIPWTLVKGGEKPIDKKDGKTRWVVKPIFGMKGMRILANIAWDEVLSYIEKNKGYYFIEPYIDGDLYRVLLLHGKILGIYKKKAPIIIGDGVTTINELMLQYFDSNLVMPFDYNNDFEVLENMNKHRVSMGTILSRGKVYQLTFVVNIARGATWTEVNVKKFSTQVEDICSRIYKALNIELLGIDVISKDGVLYVLEANPSPGLVGHSIKKIGTTILVNLKVAQDILVAVLEEMGIASSEIKPKPEEQKIYLVNGLFEK